MSYDCFTASQMMLASVLGLFVTEVIWEQKFEVTRLKVVADIERRLQHIKTGGVEEMQRAARDARESQDEEERDTTNHVSASNMPSRMNSTAFSSSRKSASSVASGKRGSINSHMGTNPKLQTEPARKRQNTNSFQEQQFVSGVDHATVRAGKSSTFLQEHRPQEDIDYENAQVLAFCENWGFARARKSLWKMARTTSTLLVVVAVVSVMKAVMHIFAKKKMCNVPGQTSKVCNVTGLDLWQCGALNATTYTPLLTPGAGGNATVMRPLVFHSDNCD